MRSITCHLLEKDVLGEGQNSDIDSQLSKQNFIIELEKELRSTFKCESIDIEFANHRVVFVDDIMSHPAVSYVYEVIEKVIQNKKWDSSGFSGKPNQKQQRHASGIAESRDTYRHRD